MNVDGATGLTARHRSTHSKTKAIGVNDNGVAAIVFAFSQHLHGIIAVTWHFYAVVAVFVGDGVGYLSAVVVGDLDF